MPTKKPIQPAPTSKKPSTAKTPAAKAPAKGKVAPIPAGQPRLSPYLVTKDAARVIEFMKSVLGGKDRYCLAEPGGKVMHAEVKIADSVVMISDASEQHPATPAMLHLYVEDVDATYAKALAAGATSIRPPSDQFYGDRSGGVKDVGGNQWWLSTHVEDVSVEEIGRRAAAMEKK